MLEKLDNLIDNFFQTTESSKSLIGDILLNTNDIIVITDDSGSVLFYNNNSIDFFNKSFSNIKEIGYLFNFDICILDDTQDIISYSPISVIMESKINTKVEATYQSDDNTEHNISIYSININNNGFLIVFKPRNKASINQSYKELEKTNSILKDKIKENEQLRAQAQSHAIRESLVNRISNAIRNSLEIDTILQTSVEELGKTLGTDRTFLLHYKHEEKELPISHEYISGKQKEIKGTIINTDKDFFLQEVIETFESTAGNFKDIWDKNKSKYKLIVPVIHHEELFGMIVMIRSNRKWHTEEINLVQSIADQISVSIKNAQLFEDATSKNLKISVLNEILKSINSSLILDDVFYTIGREIKRLINFDRASIAILDGESNKVKLFARLTNTGEINILRSGPLIAKGTAISWAIDNLKPIRINMNDNKEFADTITLKKSGIKTAIIIPMINKGIVSGIFYVGSKKTDEYTDAEVEIMTQIAGQIAVAVENAKLYWQTQTQALKETLINQIVTSIRKSLDLKEVLQTTVKELGLALGVNNCLLKYYLEDNDNNSYYEYISKGSRSISNNSNNFFNALVSQIDFNNNNLLIIDKAYNTNNIDIIEYIKSENIKSMLAMPVSFKDPLSSSSIKVGVILLSHSDIDKNWSLEDINLLKVLSDQISITINQARLFEQSQKQKEELENTLQKLKNAQAQLVQSEKMAGLGQLVAGVAHEINTPIGSINSNNSIFSKCTEKLKNAINIEIPNINKANQLLQMLEETTRFNSMACERINEIVKSLKNFARLDESDIKKVDIHEGINSTLTLVRHELKERIKIKTDYGDLPPIECYPNLLNQVLMNLIVNAIQSIKDKGSITIKTELFDKNNVKVSVADTGYGIDKDNLSKIFDPGYTTKGVGVGTGLGLSICYQIIEKHKGNISAESTPGKGSTFTIVIPINQK